MSDFVYYLKVGKLFTQCLHPFLQVMMKVIKVMMEVIIVADKSRAQARDLPARTLHASFDAQSSTIHIMFCLRHQIALGARRSVCAFLLAKRALGSEATCFAPQQFVGCASCTGSATAFAAASCSTIAFGNIVTSVFAGCPPPEGER